MNATEPGFYRHSGKFGLHGPLLAIVAGVILGFLGGYAYAYLIKWIPFVYANVFITGGYGFLVGFVVSLMMKLGHVRNNLVTTACGFGVGVLAWYFAWSAHVHTLVSDGPWFFTPGQIIEAMKVLYEQGSWGLRSFSVTGVPLVIVWVVEAVMIVGLCTLTAYASTAAVPYCEQHACWLDEERTIDKLDAFTHPAHLAAFQAGDITPLEQARPRVPASGQFGRLTIRHSAKCDDVCTISIANVIVTVDEEGKAQEKAEEIVSNLTVPKSLYDYLAQFEHASARKPSGI